MRRFGPDAGELMSSSGLALEQVSLTAAEAPRRRRSFFLHQVEQVLVVLALMLQAGAVLPAVRAYATGDPLRSDPVQQLVWAGLYLALLPFVLLRGHRVLSLMRHNGALTVLVLIAVLSIAWSIDPDLTLRRTGAVLVTTLFGVYLAARFGARRSIGLLAVATGAVVWLSLVAVVVVPELSIGSAYHPTAWKGVFLHKNMLGRACLLAFIALLFVAPRTKIASWMRWVSFVPVVLCLAFSQSATSIIVAASALLLTAIAHAFRGRAPLLVSLLLLSVVAVGALGVGVLLHADAALAMIERDATLTGRTNLWSAILDALAQRPWAGHGYSAFWGESPEGAATIAPIAGWEPPHAHNGFLQMGVDLGLVGLVMFALLIAAALRRALLLVRRTRTAAGIWPFVLISAFLLQNLTDAVVMHNSALWAAFVMAAAHLYDKARLLDDFDF